MQFVFIVHSVAEKLNYSKCKHDVSRAVGIPFSGDSEHQCTESPLQEIWWGFRPVGIPSSGDSVQWGFRVHTDNLILNELDNSSQIKYDTSLSKKIEAIIIKEVDLTEVGTDIESIRKKKKA